MILNTDWGANYQQTLSTPTTSIWFHKKKKTLDDS